MIQRIQTIYLLLATIALGVLFVLPFASTETVGPSFFQDQIYNLMDSPVLIGLCGFSILLGFISIFLFKNRPLQKNLALLAGLSTILLGIGVIALLFIENILPNTTINIGVGGILVLVAIIFLFLAVRYINKDINLVKSMDRLR